MSNGRLLRFFAALSILATAAAFAQGPPTIEIIPDEVRAVLNREKAKDLAIPAQAEALARLAWPMEPGSDARVRAAARRELVGFAERGMVAMRAALQRVDPIYRADITAALIEAAYAQRYGTPPHFLAGLDDALWYGPSEAKRLAMLELRRRRHGPAVLSIIDAISEFPRVTIPGLRALGGMKDPRARFFLRDVLLRGPDRYRGEAATALGQLGNPGAFLLRFAADSDDPSIRDAALRGLVPVSTLDDLTRFHEYIGLASGQDPALLELVTARATTLEAEIERLQQEASLDPESAP